MRRVAANAVSVGGQTMAPAVVEISDGVVKRCYPLSGEQPQTEWAQGTITVKADQGGLLRAYKNGKQIT